MSVFINKIDWNTATHIHLCTVCGCFLTKVMVDACDRPILPSTKPKILTIHPFIEKFANTCSGILEQKSVIRSFYQTWKFIKALTHLRDPTASVPDGVCLVVPGSQEMDAKLHGLISTSPLFVFINFLGT